MDARNHGKRWRGPGRAARGGAAQLFRIHWPRTLAAKRNRTLRREHLRLRPQQAQAGALHCFLIDCSGSMLAGQRLALAKGLLLQLLQRAYQQRAQIAVVSFSGDSAQLRLAPTRARPATSQSLLDCLQPLGAGGGTPLTQGAAQADAVLARAARCNPAQQRWLWLLTDGRSPTLPAPPRHSDVRIVVDCEQQRIALGRCRLLARQWQADYCIPEDLLSGAATR